MKEVTDPQLVGQLNDQSVVEDTSRVDEVAELLTPKYNTDGLKEVADSGLIGQLDELSEASQGDRTWGEFGLDAWRGVRHGATFGFDDDIAEWFGADDWQHNIDVSRARSPGLSMAAELAGSIPWLFVPYANGAKLAQAAQRIRVAGRGIGATRAGRVATSTPALMAAEGAVWGGLYGAGDVETWEGVKEGILMGAAFGGGLAVAGKGLKAAARVPGHIIKRTSVEKARRLAKDPENTLIGAMENQLNNANVRVKDVDDKIRYAAKSGELNSYSGFNILNTTRVRADGKPSKLSMGPGGEAAAVAGTARPTPMPKGLAAMKDKARPLWEDVVTDPNQEMAVTDIVQLRNKVEADETLSKTVRESVSKALTEDIEDFIKTVDGQAAVNAFRDVDQLARQTSDLKTAYAKTQLLSKPTTVTKSFEENTLLDDFASMNSNLNKLTDSGVIDAAERKALTSKYRTEVVKNVLVSPKTLKTAMSNEKELKKVLGKEAFNAVKDIHHLHTTKGKGLDKWVSKALQSRFGSNIGQIGFATTILSGNVVGAMFAGFGQLLVTPQNIRRATQALIDRPVIAKLMDNYYSKSFGTPESIAAKTKLEAELNKAYSKIDKDWWGEEAPE